MNETNGDNKETALDDANGAPEELALEAESPPPGAIPDIGGDTIVLDATAELKVDKLVAKLDATDPDEAAHRREVRKRLEALREKKDQDLDSTFNFNLDDEI